MKKENKQKTQGQTSGSKKKYDKPLREKGGVYFHSGLIIGKKNVFVTDSYLNILTNALKTIEVKRDIKSLAYVIMPNYFHWMFRLSPKNDDPVKVYSELKGEVAKEVMNALQAERKADTAEQLIDLFKENEQVNRSVPEKIIWSFEEKAKEFEGNQRYKVWQPKTGINLIDNDEMLSQKLEIIKKAPVSDRWQLVEKAEKYPYLYICDELQNEDNVKEFLPVIQQEILATA